MDIGSGSTVGQPRFVDALNGSAAMSHDHPRSFANAQLLGSMDQAVAWMHDKIGEARESVVINQYILQNGGAGRTLLDAAAKRGVQVTILADAEGSSARRFMPNRRRLERLARTYSNVEVRTWHKPIAPWASGILHDKSFSVDGGKYAAVGSGGLGPLNAKWGEEFIALEGEPARWVYAEQMGLWHQAGGAIRPGEVANLVRADAMRVPETAVGTKIVANRPGIALDASSDLISAIQNAKHRIWTQSPFYGSKHVTDALIEAKRRNPKLDVRVMVGGGHGGSVLPGIDLLAKTYYAELLAAGIDVHETTRPIHTKSTIIDDSLHAGSMNDTLRSIVRDSELNVSSNEPQLVAQAERLWTHDFGSTRPVTTTTLNGALQRVLSGPVGKAVRAGLSSIA